MRPVSNKSNFGETKWESTKGLQQNKQIIRDTYVSHIATSTMHNTIVLFWFYGSICQPWKQKYEYKKLLQITCKNKTIELLRQPNNIWETTFNHY